MALFDLQELDDAAALDPESPPDNRALAVETTHAGLISTEQLAARLEELLPLERIRPGQSYHVISTANWNSYDLLSHLVKATGPADFAMCIWSISNRGVQRLVDLRQAGSLLSLTSVVDPKTMSMKPAAGAMLRDASDRFGVYPTHAKVYVMIGERMSASVVTSANLTSNPRMEGCTITIDRRIGEFHRSWIQAALDRAAPFEYQEAITMTPTDLTTIKRLYLVRGLPGTGKTTLARMIAPAATFSADDYFENGAEYSFDPTQIRKALETCEARTRRAMELGVDRLAVANTFSRRHELQPYRELAERFGYQVAVVECQTIFGNVHGVSEEAIEAMRNRWEPAE